MTPNAKPAILTPIRAALVSLLSHSLCCLLPLALIVFGLGGVTAASVLTSYHTELTCIGIGALLFGFYSYWRTYHAKTCCCSQQSLTGKRCSFCMLMLALVIQSVVWFYPMRVAMAAGPDDRIAAATAEGATVFHVGHFHCSACVATLEAQLESVGSLESIEVIVAQEAVAVRFTDPRFGESELVAKLNDLGYDEAHRIRPIAR